MELAMKQFVNRRALQKEKEQLQLKQASQNKEQQKLIQEISQLEKELASKKKDIPPAPPKLQNLRQQKSKLQKDQQAVEVKVKKVKGLLAKAPKPTGQTLSKEVSLLIRSQPSQARAYCFLSRNGKIFPLNDVALQQMVASNLRRA